MFCHVAYRSSNRVICAQFSSVAQSINIFNYIGESVHLVRPLRRSPSLYRSREGCGMESMWWEVEL